MPVTLAVDRLRRRNRPSGISGEATARLDHEEGGEQRERDGEPDQRRARRPAVGVPVHDRVDRDHQRARDRDRAADVEAAALSGGSFGGREQPQGQEHDGDPDRKVDEEDPMPVDRVGEHAAEHDADAAAAGGDESEQPHRLRALGGLGEEREHQRERHRRRDRTADTLHRAGGDQHPLRRREPADERRRREQRDPEQEQAPLAVQVAEPSSQEEQAAECQRVSVHDPGERRFVEAEVVADRRQGDIHDRRVEHDHETCCAERVQGEPAGAIVGDGHTPSTLGPSQTHRSLSQPFCASWRSRSISLR